MMTKRAFISSPRSVAIRQRLIASSQRTPVTSVWNKAPSYSPDFFAMLWQYSRISKPSVNCLAGRKIHFLQQRQVAIGVVVAGEAGIAVPVPDPAEIPAWSITRTSLIPELCR